MDFELVLLWKPYHDEKDIFFTGLFQFLMNDKITST